MKIKISSSGLFQYTHLRNGEIIGKGECLNSKTGEGMIDMQDVYFRGTSSPTAFYISIIDSTPSFNVLDTLASHSGWTELTNYSGDRKQWFPTAPQLNGSRYEVTNDLAEADTKFTFSSPITVGGFLLTTVASGTGGILLATTEIFPEIVINGGDQLLITYIYRTSTSNGGGQPHEGNISFLNTYFKGAVAPSFYVALGEKTISPTDLIPLTNTDTLVTQARWQFQSGANNRYLLNFSSAPVLTQNRSLEGVAGDGGVVTIIGTPASSITLSTGVDFDFLAIADVVTGTSGDLLFGLRLPFAAAHAHPDDTLAFTLTFALGS